MFKKISPVTITWTTTPGDPATFDLYLTNDNFHNTYALKNVVQTATGTITLLLPVVPPGPGYTFQASPVGDVTTKLSQTGTFDVGQPLPSSSLPSSTSSGTGTLTSSMTSTPLGGSSSTGTSPSTVPSGSFNGALGVTGIGAAIVGVLIAAGAFLAL
ncbi:hypothetical protein BDM02DRAFT_6785 [Thelephora ganbajun]|uniref:Uncharacterized protein n=1 Tax=Thelephora ganbajun TaxID=370292 RepID=A0ACB6ZXK3_THEGA|nr:hypothetical protein BDM02DRAFT_6785 [Thelephora ganbajun]